MKKTSAKSISRFVIQNKEKIIRIFLGLFLVFLITSLLFIRFEPIATWVSSLENLGYDLQVRQMHKSVGKDTPITLVDIDDKSLKAEGRWPWPRNKVADLVKKLYENEAAVVAFDITFPDPEINMAEEVIDEIKKQPESLSPEVLSQLRNIGDTYDYDTLFAQSLQLGDSILGMVFIDQGDSAGVLPPPVLQLTPALEAQLAIPDKKNYLANIAKLEAASKTEGFINATPDPDGVLRFTPLLLRKGANVFGSLAFQAVSHYLFNQKTTLVTARYGNSEVLEGIKLDQLFIPTDAYGRILIPYRGLPYSFPYVSATDVIHNLVPKEAIKGKLFFLGSTASAIGDNRPGSIAPIFPGLEVHASIASGIIDHYLPYKPSWGKGVTFLLMVFFGILYAIILPFFGVLTICILCIFLPVLLIYANYWLWSSQGIVISLLLPLALILSLFLLNLIWGYLFESKRSKDIKSMFGQYVPPAYLDDMIKKGGEISLEGESKELSVLFADIRSFTNLSEKMSATELKQFLNRYFNPITEIIFNHKGTIDKYVGDMVMAFWGAPLSDPRHAFNAVSTGRAMQAELSKLNVGFLAEKKPEIRIGVGINTGIMNVGDMGSKFRRAYTVLGDTVNLASRLEGQTKFYHIGILVGETTYAQTKEDFAYRKIDKIKVKGKDTGVEVFCPICEKKDITEEIKTELEIHHQALESYFQQKWDQAEKLFTQLVSSYPLNQALYETYLERIQSLRQNPPGPNWDGAFVSHEK